MSCARPWLLPYRPQCCTFMQIFQHRFRGFHTTRESTLQNGTIRQRSIMKRLNQQQQPSPKNPSSTFKGVSEEPSVKERAEQLLRAREAARTKLEAEGVAQRQSALPKASTPAERLRAAARVTSDELNESREEYLERVRREDAQGRSSYGAVQNMTPEKIEALLKEGDTLVGEHGVSAEDLDVLDPVNDPDAHMKVLRRDLRIQLQEMKEIFAHGAASPEWKAFDREVEERIAVIEREFLLSREPITKHSVARFHAKRDEIVIETQEKWLAIQQKRIALWKVYPQKADAHDPDVRPFAESYVERWWYMKRLTLSQAAAKFSSMLTAAGIPLPPKIPMKFEGVDVWLQHTRFDPHEHVHPVQPDRPVRESTVPTPSIAAYVQRSGVGK